MVFLQISTKSLKRAKNNKNYVNIQNKDDVILSDDYKSAEKVIDENIKNNRLIYNRVVDKWLIYA